MNDSIALDGRSLTLAHVEAVARRGAPVSLAADARARMLRANEHVDRIVRNDAELDQKIEYALANPFQRWPSLSFYPWVWSRWSED